MLEVSLQTIDGRKWNQLYVRHFVQILLFSRN